jgi:ABC-type Na+ efflux pump permease subunit
MENPYRTGSAQRIDEPSDLRFRRWKLAWLLSYVTPFFFQCSVLLFFGDIETSGAASALLIFGPLGIGLLCAIAALMFSRLPIWQTALGIVVTILLYIAGLIVFTNVVALIFGVEAT